MYQDKLTLKYIDSFVNLRTDKKHERLSDGAGLWLRVTSNQTKQFRFDYIRPNSKSEDRTMHGMGGHAAKYFGIGNEADSTSSLHFPME